MLIDYRQEQWSDWCHDLAKWLSYYLYFFSFLFLVGLTIQEKSTEKYYMTNVTYQDVTVSYHMNGVT